jgi:phosphoribosylamine---glycine ligase
VRVLLVGSGGREHALAWSFSRSPSLGELHSAPGNPGMAELGYRHPVAVDDLRGLVALARHVAAEVVVVGPEAPLVAGLGDALRDAGIATLGPTSGAARIEGSKAFAKQVMREAGVPTAAELTVPKAPCVVKFDGLAAGKGVFVCRSERELEQGLAGAARLGDHVIVEELLEGDEVSVFALCDGHDALALAPARDYKRLEDGDRGPNTGGMGSFSPVPGVGPVEVEDLVDHVHRPVLRELATRGTPFVGLLYAGLMLTEDGPRVLEFNSRFGDPETQSIVPRLEGDLLEAVAAAATGQLAGVDAAAGERAAVTVVIAGADPLDRGDYGTPIEGLEDAADTGALVFHAGTDETDAGLVTAGRRVLNVTGVGDDLDAARAQAYTALGRIDFAGARFRTDIAAEVAPVQLGAG